MACCNKPLVSAYCSLQVHPNTISVKRYATNYKVQWNHKQRSIKTIWWCVTQSGYQQWSNYQGKGWRRILRSHCWRIQPVQIRWLSKRTEIQWGMKYDLIKVRFEAKKKLNNHDKRLLISFFFQERCYDEGCRCNYSSNEYASRRFNNFNDDMKWPIHKNSRWSFDGTYITYMYNIYMAYNQYFIFSFS